MIIRLVNADDLIGCGGDTYPMRFVNRGTWKCTEVHRGVHRGAQRCA